MRLGSRTYISLGLVSIVSSALVAASLLGLTGDVYEQLFIMMSVYLVDR